MTTAASHPACLIQEGATGRWLGAALALLWAAIVAVGVRRGLADGMGPWLIVLALIGALAALLVLWSLVSAMTQRG